MADKPNFVLSWKIESATARLATGRAESKVFVESGFKWNAALERHTIRQETFADFFLNCGVDHNGPWRCDVRVGIGLLQKDDLYHILSQDAKGSFNEENGLTFNSLMLWRNLTQTKCVIDETITVGPFIRIVSSDRPAYPRQVRYTEQNEQLILKIGDEKLHVSKEYLAVHSPVFETLFFGNFAENGKEEVEINNVDYEEFHDLMLMIYPGAAPITDRTVLHVLKLADQFQMLELIDRAEQFLITSPTIADKLLIADQYRLVKLRDHCLNSFASSQEMLLKLKSSPESARFSAELRLEIYDRLMKICFVFPYYIPC